MDNVVEEMVFVFILVHVVIMVVKHLQEIVQLIQVMLNVVIIFLVQLMEKVENAYLEVNVVEKLLTDYVLEEVILNAALMENHPKILHLMDLAAQVVVLVLILKELVAKQV
jgi:hypothetical protein